MVAVQLPDAASIEPHPAGAGRTASHGGAEIDRRRAGDHDRRRLALDNNAYLANAGVIYVMLKDWDVRGKAEGQLDDVSQPDSKSPPAAESAACGGAAAADPGPRHPAGFQMQVELTDGSFDYEAAARLGPGRPGRRTRRAACSTALHRSASHAPQILRTSTAPRRGARRSRRRRVRHALQTYLGSTYVNRSHEIRPDVSRSLSRPTALRLTPRTSADYNVRSTRR